MKKINLLLMMKKIKLTNILNGFSYMKKIKLTCFLLLFYHLTFASDFKVGVSIPPLAQIVEQLSNHKIQAVTLFDGSTNPHLYEPKPSQAKDFAEVSVYFSLGLETEVHWLETLQHVQVIYLNHAIPLLEGHEEHEEDEGHEEVHEGNPHTWLSPLLLKIHVLRMYQALVKLDPQHQAIYFENHQILQQQIDALDLKIQQKLSVLSRPAAFLTLHPALGYFALAYDLQELAIEHEGKSPSLQHLIALGKQAKKLGIRVILAQPQIPLKEAKSLANSLNLPVEQFNPLAKNWETELLHLADLLVQYRNP